MELKDILSIFTKIQTQLMNRTFMIELFSSLFCFLSCQSISSLNHAEFDDFQHTVSISTFIENQNDSLIMLSNGLKLKVVEDGYLFEDDMLFNDSILSSLENLRTEDLWNSRSASILNESALVTKFWTGRTVPYVIEPTFSSNERQIIIDALLSISRVSGVRFVYQNGSYNNVLQFHKTASGNNSYVGMVGGYQKINLHSVTRSVVLHEVMHSLGFFHEHSRSDRDSYIIINWDNVLDNMVYAFDKYRTGYDIGPFDYNSIMIYSSYITDLNFVINPDIPTITDMNGGTFSQGDSLSDGDVDGLRRIYGPPYHKIFTNTTIIRNVLGSSFEDFEEESITEVKFYSDTNFTIPEVLTSPRILAIAREISDLDESGNVQNRTILSYITVPPGSDTFEIDRHSNFLFENYGNTERYYNETITLLNTH